MRIQLDNKESHIIAEIKYTYIYYLYYLYYLYIIIFTSFIEKNIIYFLI